jgi:hypothetical protein
MAPELADRLAKLLRVACSTGPDGEKLAAINRLSATAAANNVDWGRIFNDDPAAAGTKAEVVSDAERIQTILEIAAQNASLLTQWETDWTDSIRERFAQYRAHLYVSEKMWAVFDRLETKFRRAGVL